MRRPLALLLLLVACASGLYVVPDAATYRRLAAADPSKQLVDVSTFAPIDVRYATPNNFMKTTLYPVARVFLRAPAAAALRDVQADLAREGLGVKVFDGYRPYRVTKAMWDAIHNPDFVADPAKGSRHNRGAAVDLTLIDLRTGAELPMPTPYDDFTSRARQDFMELPAELIANRAKLREAMTRHGFEPLPSEWWHFDFRGWERFELMDVPLEELP
ncbi:MAG TPA: M15 family metallopeptidase [Thermoanaerobaculia bacterium]|nr:M15 family metallopeptidase [Thermoanaerobaculia bacterium]